MLKKIIYIFVLTIFLIAINSESAHSKRWERVSLPSAYADTYWLDVFFLPTNTNYGWVCGFDGHVIRTTDGGNTWRGATVPGAYHLESVHFPSQNVGYTSGVQGIFKSTDGGANWFEISPAGGDTLWGCYFISEDVGMTIGRGCGGTNQQFWRTTDGGSSTWTLFEDTEPESGLTDLILYEADGLGYAMGSRIIWKTTDGGYTWSYFLDTPDNVWHEEMTNLGESFIVPSAGVTCSGAGNTGAVNFYWNSQWFVWNANLPPMFGAFITGPEAGWACGDDRNVLYTGNHGIRWEKRNCGIDEGNLDDIWVIDPNRAWVVGDGVYRLTDPTRSIDRTALNFGLVCIPQSDYDYFYVHNTSFFEVEGEIEINGADASEFEIMEPADQFFSIGACDSIRVMIRCHPYKEGDKTANVSIAIDSDTWDIDLTANSKEMTADADTLDINFDSLFCDTKKIDTIYWSAPNPGESIESIILDSGSAEFRNETSFPITLSAGQQFENIYSVVPADTGWAEAKYAIKLMPCNVIKYVNLKVYGISPVIDAQEVLDFDLDCVYKRIDTIPICNPGNATLEINSAYIQGEDKGYKVLGWTGDNTYPVEIEPGACDSIIISFEPTEFSKQEVTLILRNNDITTIRGVRDPYHIKLSGEVLTSNITPKDTLLDFGIVCLGDTSKKSLFLKNIGNLAAEVLKPVYNEGIWEVRTMGSFPNNIAIKDSIDIRINFIPDESGYFEDSLIFKFDPCDEIVKVYVKGVCEETKFTVLPSNLDFTVQTTKPKTKRVTIRSESDDDISVTAFKINPGSADWSFKVSPPLPYTLTPGEEMVFDVEFLFNVDTLIEGTLCVIAGENCPHEECLGLKIRSQSNWTYTSDNINFGFHRCYETLYDTIKVVNAGNIHDTIIQLELIPDDQQISMTNAPTIPFAIAPGDSLVMIALYDALTEGTHHCDLNITTKNQFLTQDFSVAIDGEYRTVNTTPENSFVDFDLFEYCELARDTSLVFHNNGQYPDTLLISRDQNYPGIILEPADILVIGPNGDTELKISLVPGLFDIPAEYNEKITLNSAICGKIHTIDVESELIEPQITANPTEFDFGDIWVGESITKVLNLKNESDYKKTIAALLIYPDNINFEHDADIPFDLNPGEEENINIKFLSPQMGSYESELLIIAVSECADSILIPLKAESPEEIYYAHLSIGNYEGPPGDSVTVAVTLKHNEENFLHDLSVIAPDSISFEITLNRRLFQPISILVKDGFDRSEIDFTDTNHIISGVIPGNYSRRLLNESGEIMWMHGYYLVNVPERTPVYPEVFKLHNYDKLKLTRDSGSVKVVDFCYPEGSQVYQLIPGLKLSIAGNVITNNKLKILVDSESDRKFNCIISDLMGTTVAKSINFITTETSNLNLNIEDLANGCYFITIIDDKLNRWTDRFIISR